MEHRVRAFSLVELSIVLVILGLLTGGILGGQSLIRAAELRSFSNDLNRYVTANWTFRDKYFAMPGDMNNATAFWGAQDSGDGLGTDCTNSSSSSAATCNGDGNGQICSNAMCYESHRYWQHLANAALVEGNYTGIAMNTTNQSGSSPGINAPRLRLRNVTLQARDYGNVTGDAGIYDGSYFGLFFAGGIACPTCNPHDPFLTTAEAWNIDTKIDDGKPALGRLRTFKYGNVTSYAATSANCANSVTQSAAEYDLAREGLSCAMIYTFR